MMARRSNLTDRALRYRAQAAGPRGKTCWACGSSRFVTVDHIDGVELIHATPQRRREELNREVWKLRRERGTDKTGVPF